MLVDVIICLCFINVQQNYSECKGQDIWKLFAQCIFSIHCWFVAEMICVQRATVADPSGREFQKHLYCKNACHSFMPLCSRIFCDEDDVAPVWLSHDVWHKLSEIFVLVKLQFCTRMQAALLSPKHLLGIGFSLVARIPEGLSNHLFLLSLTDPQEINSLLWTEYVRHFVPLQHSIFFLQRRIIPKPSRHTRNDKQKRPRRYWREWCVLISWAYLKEK